LVLLDRCVWDSLSLRVHHLHLKYNSSRWVGSCPSNRTQEQGDYHNEFENVPHILSYLKLPSKLPCSCGVSSLHLSTPAVARSSRKSSNCDAYSTKPSSRLNSLHRNLVKFQVLGTIAVLYQEFKPVAFNVGVGAVLILRVVTASLRADTAEAENQQPALKSGNNAGSAAKPNKLPEIAAPTPTTTDRVTAAAKIHPETASPGDTVTVLVKVRVAPGHYIYALEMSGTRSVATTLETQHSGILRPDGLWLGPEPKVKEDGSRTLSSELLFQRRFTVEHDVPIGSLNLPIKLNFQVCNDALCWPPAKIGLETKLKVVGSQ
jgi:hypothetical protein